ncbi:translin [Onthophagus taurus]|uniref:translin n=1 Tax=Onthophagus taurus TaxID=166361 RepID=UPI000C20F7CD|nr:translin [Onthophagus taurus]
MNKLGEVFDSFQVHLNNEQDRREEIRVNVKDIENTAREILTILQVIHQENGLQFVSDGCLKARNKFEAVRLSYSKLNEVIPKGEYYRFNDHWKFVTQRLCFLVALVIFLEVGILVSKETVADILGLKPTPGNGLHLDLEDYLMGVLQLTTELSRFAVNSVTNGDYDRPIQISKFVAEINAGFRVLNLKNDSLRKRFDVLKYDVKKIEEVVYDLSIRGLKRNGTNAE